MLVGILSFNRRSRTEVRFAPLSRQSAHPAWRSLPLLRMRLFGIQPTTLVRRGHGSGLEPMRWNSVKKTAQWAVFRNSPEGFSLRGRGARSAAMSPVARSSLYCAVLTNGSFSFRASRMIPLIHSPLSSAFLRVALQVALLSFLRRATMLICRIDGAAKLLEQEG